MPTTALGLLIFIVLLAPGLTYSSYRKRHTPVEKPTTLRELGGIALPSVLCDLGAVAVFAVVHLAYPGATPDIGALIAGPRGYAQQHYAALFWWGVGLLALACVLALLAAVLIGSALWNRAVDRRPLSWLTPRGGVTQESAWWGLFTNEPDIRVYAGCTLDDGSYLGGYVLSYSPNSEETADRELVLAGTITFRGAESDAEPIDLDVGAVAISARRLQYLTVSYLETPPEPEPAGPAPRWRRAAALVRVARWPAVVGLGVVTLLPLPWPLRLAALCGCVAIAAGAGGHRSDRASDAAAPDREVTAADTDVQTDADADIQTADPHTADVQIADTRGLAGGRSPDGAAPAGD